MTQSNDSTKSAKDDIEAMKSDIENFIKRLGHLKYKSGDVLSEQLDNLASALNKVKHKSENQSKAVLGELCDSTQKHPLRNLLCAAGIGAVISFIIS